MDIRDINPWWKTSKLEGDYAAFPQRELFNEIAPYVKEKQIIAINGLRRTGKTVLMHHIIGFLLRKHQPENILYYNFDLLDDSIDNILAGYKEMLGTDIKNEKIFVFLDEIQKHENWENELKLLYDNHRNIKFFISGSSSLFIEKKTKESLGGRVFSFILNPLTFKEYLSLRDIKPGKRISLYENEIKEALRHYMRTGGFPELLDMREDVKIDRYIRELVIDRIIYIDIPRVFEIEEPELLVKILSVVSANPGTLIDYGGLANDLGRNRKTISNYVFYLEKAFLIKKLYNYSRNLLTSEKKLKRAYPSSTAFAFLFDAAEGRIAENAVLMNEDFRFFSRKGSMEVDFIKADKDTLPIEVKYAKKVRERDIKGLIRFIGKHKLKQGLVITDSYEAEEKLRGKRIRFVPLWKWLLEL